MTNPAFTKRTLLVVMAALLAAGSASATLKTRTKSNNTNERTPQAIAGSLAASSVASDQGPAVAGGQCRDKVPPSPQQPAGLKARAKGCVAQSGPSEPAALPPSATPAARAEMAITEKGTAGTKSTPPKASK